MSPPTATNGTGEVIGAREKEGARLGLRGKFGGAWFLCKLKLVRFSLCIHKSWQDQVQYNFFRELRNIPIVSKPITLKYIYEKK